MVSTVYRVRTTLASTCIALGLCAAPAILIAPAPASAQAAARTEPLGIRSKDRLHRFDVEVMRSDDERSRGLMFRRSMASNHGMLFDFERSAPVAMWMKNTYLPLDMLFIRADGTVAYIAADTEPLSTVVIQSPEPVLSVLELNAGTAAKLGVRVGDRIENPLFRVP